VPSGTHIAIVDDDESMRLALTALLRALDYDVHSYASAEALLDDGPLSRFACIVTDIQMPSMSGIELKARLAESQYLRPVIMITARHEPDLERRALASGAFCFLHKSAEPGELVGWVEKAVNQAS
jgi:FixJ family two-component response regulator